ncbi:hypothetical protein WEI85_38285 [Actinomycetes bacterium KLBMP 9797]
MLGLSAAIGAGCGFVGMNLRYHLDVPSGTTIVLTGAALFAAVMLVIGGHHLQRTARLDATTRLVSVAEAPRRRRSDRCVSRHP